MKQFFIKLLKRIDSSLNVHSNDGWSARKLTTFILLASYLVGNGLYYRYATNHDNWTLFPEVKMIDGGVILCLLGLTTYQAIRGKKEETATDGQK